MDTLQEHPGIIALKIISTLLCIGLLIFIFQMLKKGEIIENKKKKFTTFWLGLKHEKHTSLKQWKKVVALIKIGTPEKDKEALFLAEKLMDEIFAGLGMLEEGLKNKLEKTTLAQIPNLPEMLEAANLSDKIKNDPEFIPNRQEILKALMTFENKLKDMDLLN